MPRTSMQEGHGGQKCGFSIQDIHFVGWRPCVCVKSKLLEDDLWAVCATFCVAAEGNGLPVWIDWAWCQEYDRCSNQCFYCWPSRWFCFYAALKATHSTQSGELRLKYMTKVINIFFSPSYHCARTNFNKMTLHEIRILSITLGQSHTEAHFCQKTKTDSKMMK